MTPEQFEKRRRGIGGSEIAAILGLDPFSGPLDVWLAKVEGYQRPVNEDMQRGLCLEAGIAEWYSRRYDIRLSTCATYFAGLALATPDRFAGVRIVSIKAPGRNFGAWGEDGSSVYPPGYGLQLQWEWLVVDAARPNGQAPDRLMHLAALVDGELRVYPVQADEELQADMLATAEAWWAKYVVPKVSPPLDASDTARVWLRRRFAKPTRMVRPARLEEEPLLLELQDAEHRRDVSLEAYEVARRRLEESIGNDGGVKGVAGQVTLFEDKNGKRTMRCRWFDANRNGGTHG